MTIERGLRLAAGVVVLLSVGMGYYVHPAWLLLTAFAGVESTAIGLYKLVPAGVGSDPIWPPALRGAPDSGCAGGPLRG